MLRFPSGGQLNSITDSDIYTTDTLPIIKQLITAWEIYFTNTAHDRVSESYWTIVDSSCTNHDVYRVHFKNKYGAYDSFSFTKSHQVNTDIKRVQYEKPLGEFKSGSSYTYNKTDRFRTSYHTEYRPTIKLNSDWITESQSIWLEELLTSPEIYLDDATHGLIPINIIDTKYTQRQHKTDKVFNLVIDFQYSFNERRQRA